jgi:hypothetical protein
MPNYKFYSTDNKIIATSSFAGKTVKGVAKCDPADTFSTEFGEKLAAARCNKKVALKRVKCASAKLIAAGVALEKAQKHLESMVSYYGDSIKRLREADDEVKGLLNSIDN